MSKDHSFKDAKAYLKWLAFSDRKSPQKGWKYTNQAHFTFENGKAWEVQPFPKVYRDRRWQKKKQCYLNAITLVMKYPKELRYVEGVVVSHVVCDHAWAVDAKGRVVDSTLMDAGIEYFGVEFDLAYVMENFATTGCIIDNCKGKWPLITGEHPRKMWEPKDR